MRIDKPIWGKLTQGTIFTSAAAEDYKGKPTWGLCITARCDMARDSKAHVFNYLPIVTTHDWLLRDGARVIADRLLAELRASAVNSLKSANKSPSVLDSYAPEFVSSTIMAGDKRFQELCEKITAVEEFRLISEPTSTDISKLALINRKCVERILKELCSHQLAGYYYIHNVGTTEHACSTGYVVLLREVHHLPQALGRKIADGLIIIDATEQLQPEIIGSAFDFACPTGLIASPWIEHIMQQFSLLFARIGLPDPDPLHFIALNERTFRGA